jgi:hypothetical protein
VVNIKCVGSPMVKFLALPWASLALRYTDLILAISGTMALTSSGQ